MEITMLDIGIIVTLMAVAILALSSKVKRRDDDDE